MLCVKAKLYLNIFDGTSAETRAVPAPDMGATCPVDNLLEHSPATLTPSSHSPWAPVGVCPTNERLCKTRSRIREKKKNGWIRISLSVDIATWGGNFPLRTYTVIWVTGTKPLELVYRTLAAILYTIQILYQSGLFASSRHPLCQNKINPECSEIGWVGSLTPPRLWRDRWVNVLQTGYMAGAYPQNPDRGALERGWL